MNVEGKYDDFLLNMLKEEGQIIPFLDTIFGFLYRRTDFYIIQDNPTAKIGFPPGIAEHVVRDAFRKWQKLASVNGYEENVSSMESEMIDLVIHEEEVVTTDTLPDIKEEPTHLSSTLKENSSKDDLSSDIYNGADCGNYRWSQTILEVDVKVPVFSNVTKSCHVRVDIKPSQLTVAVQDSGGQWNMLVDGQLSHKHIKEESIWTLLPGRQITIHLQKAGEIWWDSLFTTETKLDLTKLDVTKHVTDLPEDEHMQVEKLMVQEERKRLGILPTKYQENLNTLEKAWNLEGSPFQGTPFDPSVLHLPQE